MITSVSKFESYIRELVSDHMQPIDIIKSFLDENQTKILAFYYMGCDPTEIYDKIANNNVNIGCRTYSEEWRNFINETINLINEVVYTINCIKNKKDTSYTKTKEKQTKTVNEKTAQSKPVVKKKKLSPFVQRCMIENNERVKELREIIERDF